MALPQARSGDGGDLHLGVGLAVSALLGPPFLLLAEVDDLLVLVLGQDFALNHRTLDQRAADVWLTLAAHHQHLKGELAARLAGVLLDFYCVALREPVL